MWQRSNICVRAYPGVIPLHNLRQEIERVHLSLNQSSYARDAVFFMLCSQVSTPRTVVEAIDLQGRRLQVDGEGKGKSRNRKYSFLFA